MIKPEQIICELNKYGMNKFLGVPCSILSPLISYLENSDNNTYIHVTCEGEGLALASGISIAGRNPVVLLQNSGLGNIINPYVSLNKIYDINNFFIISMRGTPDSFDAHQHLFMGSITEELLKLLGIEYQYLDANYKETIKKLINIMEKDNKSVALLIRKDTFDKVEKFEEIKDNYEMNRTEAIDIIFSNMKLDGIFVSTTGKISRDLYYISKKAKPQLNNIIYSFGSMGYSSSIALGFAIELDTRIFVLDGDGALLMRLGNLTTIGNMKPNKLVHIVLDNECYATTGRQKNNSVTTNFAKIARSCGYEKTYEVYKKSDLLDTLEEVKNTEYLTMILIKINSQESLQIGRPDKSPIEIKREFQKSILKH